MQLALRREDAQEHVMQSILYINYWCPITGPGKVPFTSIRTCRRAEITCRFLPKSFTLCWPGAALPGSVTYWSHFVTANSALLWIIHTRLHQSVCTQWIFFFFFKVPSAVTIKGAGRFKNIVEGLMKTFPCPVCVTTFSNPARRHVYSIGTRGAEL